MHVVVDASVTSPYGGGDWRIALSLFPGTCKSRLDWHPQGLADPETITIAVGRQPLTRRQIHKIRRVVADFPGMAIIDRAVWTYLHGQDRWDHVPHGEDDLFGAVEELTSLLRESVH
ncbi:hypothetical protein ACIQU4_28385 [Streptomyces sp. NPDC090741]|uniref:hypothetical protein n=1 Tax=Streptomyces sp. NPDC090741 TaxID=3365967 RepID=UPI003815928B